MPKQDQRLTMNAMQNCEDGRDEGGRDPDVMMGAILGHLRRAEGVSQTGLGDILGVSRQRIQEYEDGVVALDLSMLQKIAKALNFDPRVFTDLVGGYQLISDRDQSES